MPVRTHRRSQTSIVAMVVATLLSSPAMASGSAEDTGADTGLGAEGSGNPIVVTATRTPVALEEAPATVTVLTDEDIADQVVTDIKDLIRYEPGISVRRAPARFGAAFGSTGRARNEDFVIRGIGGNRVLIQVDGIRAPQGFSFGAQDAGRGGYADVSLVKRVEILRGPASALYGSDGLSGVVSFTTRDPEDLIGSGETFGGFVSSAYASADEEFVQTGALAGRFGDVSALVAYTRRDFQELRNQGTVGGIGEARTLPNPQDGSSDALLGKLAWNSGDHRLRLTGEYLASEIFSEVFSGEGPAFVFGPFPAWTVDSLTALDEVERRRISLDWTYEGSGAIEFAQVAAYYQDGIDTQFTDEDRTGFGPRPVLDRTRLNTFENEVYGLNAELRASFETGTISHRMALGGDVSVTRQEGLRDGEVPPIGEFFPIRAFPVTDFTLGGVFLANEVELLDGRLTLYPALRLDFYELDPTADPLLPGFNAVGQSDSRLSPKLGLTFKLTDNLVLFGHYAQGFRAPTPSQVNNFFENRVFGYTSAPNPNLGPERSESWEGGIRYSGDILQLELVGFRADYDDFISQQVIDGSFTAFDPAVFQFVNLEGVGIEGIEAKASVTLDNGVTGRFAIAYADGTIETPGGPARPLDTVDPLNLVAGIGYRAPSGKFGGELILTHHARKPLDETTGVCPTACFRPDAATVIDLTAFYALTDNVKLRAGLFNITDATYAHWQDVRGLEASAPAIDAFTRPGRNVSISLSFEF